MIDQQVLLRLIQNTAIGDKAAFEKLYQLTAPKLLGFSNKLLNHVEWAEDLLQETYIKIWHHASEYSVDRGSVMTWMISILRYSAIDRIRAQKPTTTLPEDLSETMEDDSSNPFDFTLNSQSSAALRGCISELDDMQRNCIALAFFEGLTHEEISSQTKRPLGTIKGWIRRGMISLRRCLEQ